MRQTAEETDIYSKNKTNSSMRRALKPTKRERALCHTAPASIGGPRVRLRKHMSDEAKREGSKEDIE